MRPRRAPSRRNPPSDLTRERHRATFSAPDVTNDILMHILLCALALLAATAMAQAASSCLIAGDSIALDVGRYAPNCALDARIGIGSAAIIARVRPATLVVVSAGSNDPDNPRLVRNLEAMRARAGQGRVVWILPTHPRAAAAMLAVARQHGDAAVPFAAARDNVHPKCPRCVADFIFGGQFATGGRP
jgi:hypothetical protein